MKQAALKQNEILEQIDADYRAEHGIEKSMMPGYEPTNGNINATLLIVLERPGPKSVAPFGSGVISQHNSDPTARNLKRQLNVAGLRPEDICLTNIVPHVLTAQGRTVDNQVRSKELPIGAERLIKVMHALPNLRYVLLAGNKAQQGFSSHVSRAPDGVKVVKMWHTSGQASGNGENRNSQHYPKYQENVATLTAIANAITPKSGDTT